MGRISIKGVIIGGITDIVSTFVLTLPVLVYFMISSEVLRLPNEQARVAALTAAMQGNVQLYGILMLIGAGCSVLGGYVAARLAKHDELLNGLLSSVFCIAIGVYSMLAAKGFGSFPWHATLIAVSALSGLLGGYLRLRHIRARASPS